MIVTGLHMIRWILIPWWTSWSLSSLLMPGGDVGQNDLENKLDFKIYFELQFRYSYHYKTQ